MATGDPTGADLTSGTTNGNTLPENPNFEEREITFDTPIELTSGVKYAIITNAAARTGAAQVHWAARADNPYANGSRYVSTDSGGSWVESSILDTWFKTKASGIVKDDGSFTPTGDVFTFDTTWNAQTFTASSTYTISSIVLNLQKLISGGGTPETVTVSIRATEGVPSKAINPTPTDAAADVTLDQATITWEDGGGATSYDVYYGDTPGSLTLVSSGQAGLSFTVDGITLGSPFDYLITRYWRIDAVNASGTTTGDEWSFVSIAFDQIRVSYRLISGGNGQGPYDSPPGVQGTDWEYTGESNMTTIKKLIAAANNTIWIEDI
ncbi:hypothetical protein LCGC14_0808230 [marine sediment metagenome]|uniref:Fibronectin type-III domain-containing protein n=1 Tax=marine sediment metagenome TaxID=412755 RepID=A0A0F9Q7L9_9ZZZZ